MIQNLELTAVLITIGVDATVGAELGCCTFVMLLPSMLPPAAKALPAVPPLARDLSLTLWYCLADLSTQGDPNDYLAGLDLPSSDSDSEEEVERRRGVEEETVQIRVAVSACCQGCCHP